jgi:hypothetical protein
MGFVVRYFQNFSLSIAPHLYLCFRYAFADQCTQPFANTRSQELIRLRKESQDTKFLR